MGSGFKDFAPGDILTAADVDGYLMRQTVMTFADASARDTALSAVLDEGMVAYLEDSDYFTVYDGSAWQVFSNTPAYELVEFTSSGTFTKATYPWGKSVRVRVVGGGGGSGGLAAEAIGERAESGGGGGGGYSEKRLAMSALSSSETVTVGAGGAAAAAGANSGGAGGTSSFGSHCQATGGGGGGGDTSAAYTAAAGGAGGVGSGGDININGGWGGAGNVTNSYASQQNWGGASALAGQVLTALSISIAATAGNAYGGGASGCRSAISDPARAGAAGGAGIVIVEIFG